MKGRSWLVCVMVLCLMLLLAVSGQLKWMKRSSAEPRKVKGAGGTTKHLLLV